LKRRANKEHHPSIPSGMLSICRSYMDIGRRIFRPNVSETLGAAGYHPERVKSPEGSAGEIPCWWSGSFRNLHCDTYILASLYPFPCRPQPLSSCPFLWCSSRVSFALVLSLLRSLISRWMDGWKVRRGEARDWRQRWIPVSKNRKQDFPGYIPAS
jgi:hypothetical protein